MSGPADSINPANIDPGHTYLWRSVSPEYGRTVELLVRVRIRGQTAILCDILRRRYYRSAAPPPDWTDVPPGLPKRLSLLEDIGPVSVLPAPAVAVH